MADDALPSPIYVFTCRGTRSGHFVYNADGRDWASTAAVPRDVADSCDVQRDPSDPYARLETPEGRIRPTSPPPGWSYVAWWDHQGDDRGASSTGILARGNWTARQLIDAARRDAPWAMRVRVYGTEIEGVAADLTRMTPRDGEYIDLRWDDAPEYEVVCGHVTDAAFNEAVIGHHGGAEYAPSRWGAPRWTWARWALDGRDEWGNATRVLRLCSKPGRGCFAVTVCDVRGRRTP